MAEDSKATTVGVGTRLGYGKANVVVASPDFHLIYNRRLRSQFISHSKYPQHRISVHQTNPISFMMDSSKIHGYHDLDIVTTRSYGALTECAP
jgi:hypothetical protein